MCYRGLNNTSERAVLLLCCAVLCCAVLCCAVLCTSCLLQAGHPTSCRCMLCCILSTDAAESQHRTASDSLARAVKCTAALSTWSIRRTVCSGEQSMTTSSRCCASSTCVMWASTQQTGSKQRWTRRSATSGPALCTMPLTSLRYPTSAFCFVINHGYAKLLHAALSRFTARKCHTVALVSLQV